MKRSERVEKAHELFNLIAPTGTEQAAMTRLRNEAEKEGAREEDVFRLLLAAMWDGTVYGNWPT